ncbi:MAG: PIN domain-containing protein [Cyanobacteria bacterium J06642_3]
MLKQKSNSNSDNLGKNDQINAKQLKQVILSSEKSLPKLVSSTGEEGLYRLHFSQEILDETTGNLVERNKMSEKQAVWFEQQIKQHFPESIVEDYESLISSMTNDFKDRHVLAAAIKCKANIIVTYNLKDFTAESLEPWGIKAQHPDEFLLNLFSDYEMNLAVDIVAQQAADLKKPPMTIKELITLLEPQVPDFARLLLYYKYSPHLSYIAVKTLELMGSEKQNKILSYEESEYSFEISNQTLTIKQQARGEIFKQTDDTVNCNFTLEDIEKLEIFEQKLDKQHEASITKN